MTKSIPMVEIWRGDALESHHNGHAVICNQRGDIVENWGDPELMIYPRSSCKMVQALPLIESGAAAKFGLTSEHLALASASHEGASIHTDRVGAWLGAIGLADDDLRCGAHRPFGQDAADDLVRNNQPPCQIHNNCSGKHAGFLTLSRHFGARPEYVDPDHPVQIAVRDAFEDMTGLTSPGFGIDGCSAPNYLTSLQGLARAAARMGGGQTGIRGQACADLVAAMIKHPELVAGQGRACTELMRATDGAAALKTGAEGVFVAILPQRGLGIAVKAADGSKRASEAIVAALLVKCGVLDASDPMATKRLTGPIQNWRGIVTGEMRLAPGFPV